MCEYCELTDIKEINLKPFFENDAIKCQYHYNYSFGNFEANFYPTLLITPKNGGITSYAFKGLTTEPIYCIMCGRKLEMVKLYYPHKLQMLKCGITNIEKLREKYKDFNK